MKVALVGNPNSGKSSLFNALTGANQYVGNWPGVTVEKKEGCLKKNPSIQLQDLPGIYSLSPYTPEEVIARNYLIHERPDLIINIVDATNLERNLYLTTQLLDLDIPVIVGLNMMDVIKKNGRKINVEKLSYGLGVPVVPISVLKKDGIDKLTEKILHASIHKDKKFICSLPGNYDDRLEASLHEIESILGENKAFRRWYAIKYFERDSQLWEKQELTMKQKKEIEQLIALTEKIIGEDSETIMINERYEWLSQLTALCVVDTHSFQLSISDKIDQIVTNRWLALPIFAFVMWFVYYVAIQTIGTTGTDWVNDTLFGHWIPQHVENILANWQVASWMQQLILHGIIAGVGAVLGFLPQLIVLFLCLSFLEDCGYMSRIAFVMDRLFRKFGLSGKSFIPMLIATGCGVPGVMASRTIENEQDRRLTIMVTTFMPCSAKLPIIALIAGAFFPHASWVAPSAYFLGMSSIVFSGIMLKKTKLFAGDTTPFIMELPAYHLPQWSMILRQTFDRSLSFVKKAGSIIFVSSILIWFSSSYNFHGQAVSEDQSILAGFGRIVAPVFQPLGWGNWQGTVATITGLVAKENIIGTFGILFGQKQVAENGHEIWQVLQNTYTSAAAYSLLAFNLLCAPCFAAIGAIHREMNSKKWTLIAVGYQCGFAYFVSFIIYQFAHLLEGGHLVISTYLAVLLLLFMGYALLKKQLKEQKIVTITLEGGA
ncbi:ferrous iron transport protein B [Enterococcus villorum]|uniref:Ferrous iron transport protein B n=1 Tax=Enterococcus villorum TaxID=112904 RepID=A0A1V8YNW1_9ENTE|nr:ferrous iron transport protein B [Enterococcus villorum]OQO70531.1 ferrous iron transport protein B [Enterococcus villorum]OQO74301.1 ferrous iron transport protein B [Enterococcus villorum]